jgi:hypothetical protein
MVVIGLTGIGRLILSLNGTPNSTARWLSMTVLVWIGSLYYAIRVQTSGFGSYKQLLVICVHLNLVAQIVAIAGILTAIFTGTPNIFSAPEFSFGGNGATWLHAGAHLFIGTIAGSVVPWLIGSLVMLITKKLAGSDARESLA